MPVVPTKSRLFRLLLVLSVVHPLASISSTAGDGVFSAATASNSPPSSAQFSYLMLDVVDSVNPNDLSWRVLLIKARGEFKGGSMVLLKYEGDNCDLGPHCDRVRVYNEKDRDDVVWYKVQIQCGTESPPEAAIDAARLEDIAAGIAAEISKHDKLHVVQNDKQSR